MGNTVSRWLFTAATRSRVASQVGIRLDPVPIATIYLDHNSSSHFRPVADSLRV